MRYQEDILGYFGKLKAAIDAIPVPDVELVMNLLEDARKKGKRVYIMGNGGSAATASHYVCDFNKGVSEHWSRPYRFVCLNDNVPSMMAYSNDVSYEEVFVGQLRNFLEAGDVVIGISGSGNSRNVIKALEYAKAGGGVTVGITGFDGGRLAGIADYSINVRVDDMQLVEDVHLALDHCMMKILGSREE